MIKNDLYPKKTIIILISLTLNLFVVVSPIYSQSPTIKKTILTPTEGKITGKPTAVPTPSSKLDKDLQQLKDKIATKVAELRQNTKTIVAGYVSSNDKTTITVLSENNTIHKITYDDTISKIVSIKKTTTEPKIDDIKKDDYVVVSGLEIEDAMTASTIYIDQQYLVLSGKVSDVKKPNFEITVVTTNKDTYTLEVEPVTKQFILDSKTNTVVKAGFSKINVGDTIHFVIVKPKDATINKSTIVRYLLIPQEYFSRK